MADVLCHGTAHAPHHAPKDWIAKFKGQFDQGWDKMREKNFDPAESAGHRTGGYQADSALARHPRLGLARRRPQEGLRPHDGGLCRRALPLPTTRWAAILDAIEEMGELDNTLVIYIQGDNGASAEGGQQGLLNEMAFFNGVPEDFKEVLAPHGRTRRPDYLQPLSYRLGARMDTPFQWTKQIASHFGGTRNGLVISWPARIKDKGGIRTQFHHVIDISPTILEAVGVQSPSVLNGVPQKPIEGVSMVYTFDNAKAPSKRRTQYFEMFANRAIYNDGWVAATTPPLAPWDVRQSLDVDDYKWELYNVDHDFSEANDLAAQGTRRSSANCRTCSGSKRQNTTCCRWTTARSSVWTSPIAPASPRAAPSSPFIPARSASPKAARRT